MLAALAAKTLHPAAKAALSYTSTSEIHLVEPREQTRDNHVEKIDAAILGGFNDPLP